MRIVKASGVAFAMQGNLPVARERIEAALKIDPDNLSAHSNLGVTLFDQGRLEEAETCYRQALAINPDCAPLC